MIYLNYVCYIQEIILMKTANMKKTFIIIMVSFILSINLSFGEDFSNFDNNIQSANASQTVVNASNAKDVVEKPLAESEPVKSDDEAFINNYSQNNNSYGKMAKILTFIVFCFLIVAVYLWKKSSE